MYLRKKNRKTFHGSVRGCCRKIDFSSFLLAVILIQAPDIRVGDEKRRQMQRAERKALTRKWKHASVWVAGKAAIQKTCLSSIFPYTALMGFFSSWSPKKYSHQWKMEGRRKKLTFLQLTFSHSRYFCLVLNGP